MLGWPEIILIFAALLLVMGPSKLPEMAKALGNAMREFQKAQTTLDATTRQLETQLNTAVNTLPPPIPPDTASQVVPSGSDAGQPAPVAAPIEVPTVPEEAKKTRLDSVAAAMGISTDGKTEEQLRAEIVEALGGQEDEKEVK